MNISWLFQIVDFFFPLLCPGCEGYVKGNRFFVWSVKRK